MEPKQFLNFLKDAKGTVMSHYNTYKGILSSSVNQGIHCVLYDIDTLVSFYESLNESSNNSEKK